jgi:hypothetical protein
VTGDAGRLAFGAQLPSGDFLLNYLRHASHHKYGGVVGVNMWDFTPTYVGMWDYIKTKEL